MSKTYNIFYKMWSVDPDLFYSLVHIYLMVYSHPLKHQATGTEQATLTRTIPIK